MVETSTSLMVREFFKISLTTKFVLLNFKFLCDFEVGLGNRYFLMWFDSFLIWLIENLMKIC